jgi:N-acyl-D-aspartate/D-glutamate deacylase
MRNLAVVEGMDIDALRAGINWEFESFAEYLAALRRRAPDANLAVFVGHSALRTAVMGEDASVRKRPTAAELAEMQRLVADAMREGAIGLATSYSLNHSGWGGVPMPSTTSEIGEFDALVGAMGGRGKGVVEIASGRLGVAEMEEIAARHGRRIFMGTALALYNEEYPRRAIAMFDACAAAQVRGNGVHIQLTCQPLSFDFTLASAYPFYSHEAFEPIKGYSPKELKVVFRDAGFCDRFRQNLRAPRPGTVFQGNWRRVVVAVPALRKNAGLANRSIADIAGEQSRDPLDVMLDLGLEEDLQTAFLGLFEQAALAHPMAEEVKPEPGVAQVHQMGAGIGERHDPGRMLQEFGHAFVDGVEDDLPEGVRRLTSHQAGLYGIPDRGRIAAGAFADLLLFDPDNVGVSPARRVNDLPGGGQRTIRDPLGVHASSSTASRCSTGATIARSAKGRGSFSTGFCRRAPRIHNGTETAMGLSLREADRIVEGAVAKARELNYPDQRRGVRGRRPADRVSAHGQWDGVAES